jgi:hypothetical protein
VKIDGWKMLSFWVKVDGGKVNGGEIKEKLGTGI